MMDRRKDDKYWRLKQLILIQKGVLIVKQKLLNACEIMENADKDTKGETKMKDFNVKNKVVGTNVTIRVWKGGMTLFVTPRKHSKYSITVSVPKEVIKEIKKCI